MSRTPVHMARREPSTTSLSKYLHTETSHTQPRNLDFCNAFWGPGDGGVDVLLARIRGATRTVEEVKAYYKERANIEEEYSKRLNKLAQMNVGRDEIGELRNSIDTLRLETDKQATSHMTLAKSLRKECETAANSLLASKIASHKKNHTAAVERFFKTKQTQESYVAKSKSKYETDCNNINSYTAQTTIWQGKELEKIQLKLERSLMSVKSSEKEYKLFVKNLNETWGRWEKEWKDYCDRSQDLEEERIEFLKDNLWIFANAVSTVCVSDDESCEHLRVALEQLEPEKDMENFVRDYGTGSTIVEAPTFIDYSIPQPVPPAQRPRVANFARSSMRAGGGMDTMSTPMGGTDEDEDLGPNLAGMGTVRDVGDDEEPVRAQSRASQRNRMASVMTTATAATTGSYQNGAGVTSNAPAYTAPPSSYTAPPTSKPPPAQAQTAPRPPANSQQSLPPPPPPQASDFKPPRDPHAAPVDPTAETMIKIGDRAYPANPSKDPQVQGSSLGRKPTNKIPVPTSSEGGLGGGDDPLFRQMNELQKEGSLRRDNNRDRELGRRPTIGQQFGQPQQANPSQIGGATPVGSGSSRTTMNTQTSAGLIPPSDSVDYTSMAESLVGAHPSSRPSSPAPNAGAASPPMAKHMQAPSASTSSPHIPVEEVLSTYGQMMPNERHERSASRNSFHTNGNGNKDGFIEVPAGGVSRPGSPARDGFAGIGAQGRSPSPHHQPAPYSQGPPSGPAPMQPQAHQQMPMQGNPAARQQNAYMAPPSGPVPNRAPSPGVGIRLDTSGRVVEDARAEAFGRGSMQMQPQQGPPPQQHQPQQYGYQNVPRAPSPSPHNYGAGAGGIPPQITPGAGRGVTANWAPPQQYPAAEISAGYPMAAAPNPARAPQRQNTQTTMYNPHSPSRQFSQPIPSPVQQQPPPQPQVMQGPAPGRYGYPPGQGQPPPPQPQQQPPPQAYNGGGYNGGGYPGQQQPVNGYPAQGAAYIQQQQQQQPPPQPQQQPVQNYQQRPGPGPGPSGGYGQPHRSPSPQPPPQQRTPRMEEQKILFYVKALYDYRATIDEEFDFQANDIIAVTSTPDDGWWTGMLLDDTRRIPGRTVFPSNFVTFF